MSLPKKVYVGMTKKGRHTTHYFYDEESFKSFVGCATKDMAKKMDFGIYELKERKKLSVKVKLV